MHSVLPALAFVAHSTSTLWHALLIGAMKTW